MTVGVIVKDPETGDIYKCVKVYRYLGADFVKWRWGRWNQEPVRLYSTYDWKKVSNPELNGEEALVFGKIYPRKKPSNVQK